MKMIRKLICKLIGHKYKLKGEGRDINNNITRIYICSRCVKEEILVLGGKYPVWTKVK
jgi:hypothetical protein